MSDNYFIQQGACPDCQGRLLPGDSSCAHCGRELPADVEIGTPKRRREIDAKLVIGAIAALGVAAYLCVAILTGGFGSLLSVGDDAIIVPDENGYILFGQFEDVAEEYVVSENAGDEDGLKIAAYKSLQIKEGLKVIILQEREKGIVSVRVRDGDMRGMKAFTTWDHLAPIEE